MKSRRWLIGGAVLAVVGIGAFVATGGAMRTIRLSAGEIQSEVSKKFPFEKRELIIAAKFTNPTVQIDPGTDRVRIGFSTTVTALGMSAASGHTEGSGVVRYEPSTGELFLDSPKVDVTGFEMSVLPTKYRNAAGELIGSALQEYLARTPVYKLSDKDTHFTMVRLGVKSIRVRDSKLEIALGL